MKINYHTHTTRCHHAVGTEEEYIQAAISQGYTVLGFSDHVPQPFKDGYVSPIRMTFAELDGYFDTLLSLREKYKDQIKILIGFEVEYYTDLFDELYEILSSYPTEYMILGQHHAPYEDCGFYSGDPTASEAKLKCYVDQVIEALDTHAFTYLAHPDLINYTGPDDIYFKHMERLCQKAIATSTPLEINLLGLLGGRHYPCDRFYKLASSMNCDFVVGLDAHSPHQICDPDNIQVFNDFLARNNLTYDQDIVIRPL